MADEATSQRESWWVLQAQSGSHEALNELFKSVQEPLFRYIASLVRDQSLAEDILQEVFIRIYRKLRWLREPAAFRAWAYQIASREAFRYLNRERRWSDQIRDETIFYSIVVLGVVALGAYINRGVARLLKAIELQQSCWWACNRETCV